MKAFKTRLQRFPFLTPAQPFLRDPASQPPESENQAPPSPPRRYRTIWISDIHLGTRGCKAEFLLDFLRYNESETLFLVGDIVDGWQIKRAWYWEQSHNDVIQKILRKARKGTRVIYVPGNHDDAMRQFTQLQFGGILVAKEWVHQTADRRKLLVIHGDEYDGVIQFARWLAILGDWSYQWLLRFNTTLNAIRKRFGLPYWSLSAYLKHRVKNAVAFIDKFESTLAQVARQRKLDGIVCGHIHHPEIRDIGGVLYCNDGDWVESCSALVEHFDGRLEIVRWTHVLDQKHRNQTAVATAGP